MNKLTVILLLLFTGSLSAQRSLDSLLSITIPPPYRKEVQQIGKLSGLEIDVVRIMPLPQSAAKPPRTYLRLNTIDYPYEYACLLTAAELADLIDFLRLVQPHSADRVQVYTEYYHRIGPGLQVRFYSDKGKWWVSIDTDTLLDRGKTSLPAEQLAELYRLLATAAGLVGK